MGMSKKIKDLKLKKVGSEEKSENDKLYSVSDNYYTEKDAKKIEKKGHRRRFFTGFAAISIVFVLICTLFVGAFVAWDMYAKEPTGLTLPEAVSMLADLYKDGSGIVTNPYNAETDLESFYTDLKKGLYVSQDCEISINDIVSGILSNATSGENGNATEEVTLSNGKPLVMSDESAPEVGANGSITGNQALDDLLESLEFDFSVLEGKTDSDLEKEMLELSDKELAAVLNEAFGVISEIDALKNFETQYGLNIAAVVSVQQVIIDKATVLEQEDARVLVTIKLNLRDAAKTALANNKEQLLSKLFQGKEVPSIVSSAVDALPALLPETLYVTASVFPNQQTWSAQVIVNNMSEKQQTAVNNLLDKFLSAQDEDGNSISFMQSINAKVYDTIAKINDIIPVNFTPSGTLNTKPIQAVINMLGAENLTQGDFLALVRDVKLPTAESLGVDGYNEESQIIAANDFINGEFSTKYYFNNEPDTAAGETDKFITASNLFSKISTLSDDENSLRRIEIRDRIVEGLDYEDGGAFRPVADEDTLAALLNGYLKNQNFKVENMEPWIMAVDSKGVGIDSQNREYFTLDVTIELDLTSVIDAQLGDNTVMKNLVKQLLPDAIYVFLTYTQYTATDGTKSSTALIDINKKGNDESRKHFETLISLLNAVQKKGGDSGETPETGEEGGEGQVSGLSFDELQNQLNQKIFEAFADIETNMGVGIEFTSTGAILPNIFEVLANNSKLKYDPELDGDMTEDEFNDLYKMTGEDMYFILSRTYKYDAEGTEVETNMNADEVALGISGFVSEIDKKYYIETGDDWTINNIQDKLTEIGNNYASVLRMTAAEGQNAGLLEDETNYEELNPYLSQFEFANIVNGSGKLDNLMKILPTSKIEYISIYNEGTTPVIKLRIKGDVDMNVEGETTIEENKKYATLFPYGIDIIVTIEVGYDTFGNEIYDASVDINAIGDEYIDKMLFFVRRFSGQTSTGDGQELSKAGLEQTIEGKLATAFGEMKAGGSVDIEFVDEEATRAAGIEFSTIFELAVNKVYDEVGEVKPSGELMRSTIKGLHKGLDGYVDENGKTLSNSAYVSPIDEDNMTDDDIAKGNSTFLLSISGQDVTIEAQFLDAYMSTKMSGNDFTDIVGGVSGDINFYQSYILPNYTNGSEEEQNRAALVRSYFNLDTTEHAGTSYLMVTLKVNTANLAPKVEGNKLVPSVIYISAQIPLEQANAQQNTRIFVNTMDDDECKVMNRILKSIGYDKTLFGDGASGQTGNDVVSKIFNTNLVDYEYTVPIVEEKIKITVTVDDVVRMSDVWYCSQFDGDEDNRRPYIIKEAGKEFGAATDPRYGVAYLKFEETRNISDFEFITE